MTVSLVRHFNMRLGEWLSSLILVSLAILLLSAKTLFSNTPAYFAVMSQIFTQIEWGFTFGLIGWVRVVALYVNGRKPITPYIRMALSFFSCFVWFEVTLGLFASGVPGFGWAIFPWLLALDMYNVFRSSADAREVFDLIRASRSNGNEKPS